MVILLIIFLIYLYLYYSPKLDKTVLGEWIIWYNYKEEVNKGVFKNQRRFIFIKKFNPFT